MMNDVITSFSIYRLLIKKKFQFIRISDFIIILAGLVTLSYFINKLIFKYLSENNEMLTYLLLFLTSMFLGLFITAGAYNIKEMHYLVFTSIRMSLPVMFLLLKVLVPLFCLNILMLGVMLWGRLIQSIYILVTELNVGFLLGIGLFFGVQKIGKQFKFLQEHLSIKQYSLFLSHHPTLKKELIYMFSLQRILPLAFVFAICQIIIYLLMDYPLALLVTITLTIVFMHDAWTINLLGLEEDTIKMYLFNHLDLKHLIFNKWATCLILIVTISSANYLIWGLLNLNSVNLMLSHLIKITLFNIALSMICTLLGLCFSDYEKRGYYRIKLLGVLLFALSTAVLFYLFISSSLLLLTAALGISFCFVRTFRDGRKLRGVIYD